MPVSIDEISRQYLRSGVQLEFNGKDLDIITMHILTVQHHSAHLEFNSKGRTPLGQQQSKIFSNLPMLVSRDND